MTFKIKQAKVKEQIVSSYPQQKFRAKLFVTLQYNKGKKRDVTETLKWYKEEMAKEGIIITKMELLKENSKDRYAEGNKYLIEGVAKKYSADKYTKFFIFHDSRVDYFNAFPIKYNSIELLE